jgi:hypothetical protein
VRSTTLGNSKRNFTTSKAMLADPDKILNRASAFSKEMEEYKKKLDQSKAMEKEREQEKLAGQVGTSHSQPGQEESNFLLDRGREIDS